MPLSSHCEPDPDLILRHVLHRVMDDDWRSTSFSATVVPDRGLGASLPPLLRANRLVDDANSPPNSPAPLKSHHECDSELAENRGSKAWPHCNTPLQHTPLELAENRGSKAWPHCNTPHWRIEGMAPLQHTPPDQSPLRASKRTSRVSKCRSKQSEAGRESDSEPPPVARFTGSRCHRDMPHPAEAGC